MSTSRMNKDDFVVYPKTKDGIEMSLRRSKDNLEKTLYEFIITGSNENIALYKNQRLEEAKINGKKTKSLFYKPQYSSGNSTSVVKKYLIIKDILIILNLLI
ncbi:hypothetical protein [Francisella philomiragia]|uniref:hypothetical protein n=1 Tax=Francisella philomiragia TaxID=28110 RepID=UPI0019054E69|nr:hypothetical protein [Francisella philomiragia]MBK2296729.1 hypothetical protein [Francisella philomiragia]MBK2341466.1 hypothetical protein [Francisella philomiragia]